MRITKAGLRLCWSHAIKSDFLSSRPDQHTHGKYRHNASTLTMFYTFMYYTPAQIFINLICRIPVISRVGENVDPSPKVIKLFSCSTQLSTEFILLVNVKMPTIVGILTFISMINITSERLKARIFSICFYFSFYEQVKFHAHLS